MTLKIRIFKKKKRICMQFLKVRNVQVYVTLLSCGRVPVSS